MTEDEIKTAESIPLQEHTASLERHLTIQLKLNAAIKKQALNALE